MPINNITQTISELPAAGRRGVDVQTVFVNKQEDFQDHLQGTTVTELNTLKDQLNSRIGEINSTTTTMNGYADTASAGAATATTKAGEASTSASEALTSRNQASTFATNSSNSATKASQWADNNYNVEVETGKYSAKHWATVAQSVDVSNKVDKDMSGYTLKATPIDADLLALSDSGAAFGIKKLSWLNLKNTLKTYLDTLYNFYNPTPIIATGTATFTATTNNINLTGISIGVEIGDVIQISGAEDAKNNSEFTVEVITDANNVIVNQAHANKGTSKNVAARASDTGVTVKLLAKWYNASDGLGQGWVNVTPNRALNVTYPNAPNRSIIIALRSTLGAANVTITTSGLSVYEWGSAGGTLINVSTGDVTIPRGESYLVVMSNVGIGTFMERR